MLNILSLNCGLAFAPYLVESLSAFIDNGAPVSRVVRQGGSGLIIRSEELVQIRHQNRQAELGSVELRHYLETLKFRVDGFEIQRTSDEVVLATFGCRLLISHPQSDLWLDAEAVKHLLEAASGRLATSDPAPGFPDWITVSAGADQLLISDQRNGRWVLLGSDHVAELERRVDRLGARDAGGRLAKPPTILLKGVTVHLQSAGRLLESLRALGENGEVSAFEEVTPLFSLRVARSIEGIELSDSNSSAGINAREARKWTGIVRGELARLKVTQVERGLIRTVFADGEDGRWVLQWGDEILLPGRRLSSIGRAEFEQGLDATFPLSFKQVDGTVLILSHQDAACVGLTAGELDLVTGGGLD